MSLLKLLSSVDTSTKSKLLGEHTTRLLRYTFAKSEEDSLPAKALDRALAYSLGEKMVRTKKNRGILLDSVRVSVFKALGHQSFQEGHAFYIRNLEKFIRDFEIEEEFTISRKIDERTNSQVVLPIYGECNGVNAFLHDYQYQLKVSITPALLANFRPNLLVTMPTGAGKTILGMEVIVDFLRVNVGQLANTSICWVVDSKELCEQSLQSFQKIWKQKGDHPVAAQRFFSRFDDLGCNDIPTVTFASFDLLVSRLTTDDVDGFLSDLDLLVIDEAHSSNASTYRRVISQYERSSATARILGLTATPFRNDDEVNVNLKSMFKKYIRIECSEDEFMSPIQYLQKGGYLAEINFETISHSERSLNLFGFYNSLHSSVLKHCNTLCRNGENIIIFAESKSHAICLSIYLGDNGVENGLIIGETSDPLRKSYISRFGDNSDSLNVLVNHQILSTGIDVPGMNAIMILSRIESPSLALQVLGRAMRGPENGGNATNKVFLTKENHIKMEQYNILENLVLK